MVKEASVGEFSCVPYILALFSAFTWGWYGFPIVSDGWENLSLFGTCAVGVLFEASFVVVYVWFAPRDKKVHAVGVGEHQNYTCIWFAHHHHHHHQNIICRPAFNLQKSVVLMVSLVVPTLCVIVSLSSFVFHTHHMRKQFVGSIGIVTSISMYSAPLVAVVSTRISMISYHRI